MDKTICELFAGVGGFRLAFEHESKEWKTVWANQWEPGRKAQDAFDCYCAHFGGKLPIYVNQDIALVDKDSIPDHNLLVGGFPCQDYSVARTGATGIVGKKGVLWWQIYDTMRAKHPPFVLLENVDRLLKSPGSQRGRDFGIILACFNKLGYNVEWRVINAAEYGFAQRRRRTFIFAYKRTTDYGKNMESVEVPEYLDQKGFFASTFPIEPIPQLESTTFETEDIADISDQFKFPFCNTGIMRNGTIYTGDSVPKMKDPTLLKDILQKDVPEKYYLGDKLDTWKYLKGAKHIERTARNGHKYVFSEGPIAFPDPIDRPARTMLTSESTTNRSTHVIEDPQTGRLRLLTPVEAERIQGFDDEWTNTGMSERMRFFCMGNALVVGLVQKMAETMDGIFKNETK
jgi:DNA (cytosine-5)-methyltransferase 1